MSAWPTARSAMTCSWGLSEFQTDASVAASTRAPMTAAFSSRSCWASRWRIAPREIHAASRLATMIATTSTTALNTMV